MSVAAFVVAEGNGDDLSALGIVTEAGGIRHADEFEIDQRLLEFKRFRNDGAQLVGIRPVGDDHEFAIEKAIRSRRISRAGQRHGKRVFSNVFLFHGGVFLYSVGVRGVRAIGGGA